MRGVVQTAAGLACIGASLAVPRIHMEVTR